jgi:hypothetical protein
MASKEQNVSFIHTADWHICDVQYGRAFRGEDVKKSIREVLQIAEERKVDFILNGGDTLDRNRPSGSMLDFLFEVDAELKRIGIPMYTVTGNHDAAEPSFLTFPGYERKEGGAGIICIDDQIIEHKGIKIAGFPARPWQEVQEVMVKWAEPVDIVCWHGAVDSFIPFPMESAWMFEAMPENKCRAYLLGDIHLRGRQRLSNEVLVSYPGTVELRDRGEPCDKFVDLYELPVGWRSKPFPEPAQEIMLDTRPVLFLRIDDDIEADKAVLKIQEEVLRCRGRTPMIFLSYNKGVKSVIKRILNLIDRSKTVFRFRILGGNAPGFRYANTVAAGMADGKKNVRPDLMATVDEVVPPGTPLNKLAKELADPLKDTRMSLGDWIEKQLADIDNGVSVPSPAPLPPVGVVIPGLEWVAQADSAVAKAKYESSQSDTAFEP